MKINSKEKCMNTALSLLSASATKMAAQSLNEISMATWYQPKIDVTAPFSISSCVKYKLKNSPAFDAFIRRLSTTFFFHLVFPTL